MTSYDRNNIKKYLDYRSSGSDHNEQGRKLEDLTSHIFGKIPGVEVISRNQPDKLHGQEIDVLLWNTQARNGLFFLPNIIPIECKNFSKSIEGMILNWFVKKIRNKGLSYGIIVARSGISGDESKETFAYHELANALHDGIRIIVITGQDLEKITDTSQFVEMLRQKLLNLAIPAKVSKTKKDQIIPKK